MKVNGREYASVSYDVAHDCVNVIDQRVLPYRFMTRSLRSTDEMIAAITDMTVRGAPAIGILAAWAARFAVRDLFSRPGDLQEKIKQLAECRPTAVNLSIGTYYVMQGIKEIKPYEQALAEATRLAAEFTGREMDACRRIGENGVVLLEAIYHKTKKTVHILTHCNAGWLACGDWGTALSPVFMAKRKNIPVHVWVDETRPRNQGAQLTGWELWNEEIPFTIIPDNSGGLLMQKKEVDIVITGADRIAANGDTANKIGTYLKALAANDNRIPFYVAAPFSTFDFSLNNGCTDIPIEQRSETEVRRMSGIHASKPAEIEIIPEHYPVKNHAFDVTPFRLINGFITEKGIISAAELKSES